MKNSFLFLSFLFLVSCGKQKIPECPKCKIYAGDSQAKAMVRSQDNEFIYADSEEFDDMVGMTSEGFTAFVDTYINGCREWKTKRLKRAVKSKTFKQNWLQIKKAIKKK